jgi:hypothetical protein
VKTKFIDQEFKYDGSQLRPLFAYIEHDLLGDSMVSWVGPCNVDLKFMKDGEDLKAKEEIRGDKMVHFIVEVFDSDLFGAVALQRLLTSIAKDELAKVGNEDAKKLIREGDDLFLDDKKLSISVAIRGNTSSMIHFAVNCVNTGTPVKTCSLEDLKVTPQIFAKNTLATFSKEVVGIQEARKKVFPA